MIEQRSIDGSQRGWVNSRLLDMDQCRVKTDDLIRVKDRTMINIEITKFIIYLSFLLLLENLSYEVTLPFYDLIPKTAEKEKEMSKKKIDIDRHHFRIFLIERKPQEINVRTI